MTLPNDIIFPFRPSQIESAQPEKLAEYMRDLLYTLSRVYQDTAQAINGELNLFTPTIVGSSTPGTASYSTQVGWFFRQGLLVDIWCDLAYSGHTGSGNTQIVIPYEVANSIGSPFVGTCENVSGVSLNGGRTYMVSRAIPENFRIAVDEAGSGVVSQPFPLVSSGQFRVHTRFIGVFIEP